MAKQLFTVVADAGPVSVVKAETEEASIAMVRRLLNFGGRGVDLSLVARVSSEDERRSFEHKASGLGGEVSLAGILLET
jgi:hypothetical protein